MAEAFALHEGPFGRVAVLKLRAGLVAHAHSDAHIVWWLGGSPAEARIGKEVVQYSESCASAVNAFEQHNLTLLDANVPTVLLAFYFKQEWLERMSMIRGIPCIFPHPAIPIGPELRTASWKLLDLLVSSPEQWSVINEAVERLIQETVKASRSAGAATEPPLLAPFLDFRLRRAIALMREHLDASLPVGEVASRVGLSRARLFALFRDQLNTTPNVLWSAIRLEEAIRKLTQQDEALENVANDLGFSAPSNFSRFFKEHTGVSPSEYRRAAATESPHTITGLPG